MDRTIAFRTMDRRRLTEFSRRTRHSCIESFETNDSECIPDEVGVKVLTSSNDYENFIWSSFLATS